MRPAGTRARGRPSRGPPHVVQAAHRTGSQGPRHGAARGPGQGRLGSAGLRPVGGLRGGAAAGTGGGCAPAPQGAGRPVGTQRCGPVSRTGKQGAEVRTCGWTQATTSTDGSQGRGLGDKPWPPPTTCSLGFCICGVGASGPRLTEVASVGGGHRAGRTRWTRRWEPPAPGTGSPRARGRGSAAWAPASSWRVREHGGERGQTLATERQRDPSGEQQPVPSRSQSAVHAPSCSLQVPGDGGGDAGGAQRSCEDPARGTRHPAEPAAEAGSGRDPAVGTPAADSLPRAGGGRGAGGGSRGGDGGGEPLGPRSAGSPPRNRAGLRVTAGAQRCRRLHLPPLPVG